MTCNKGTVLLLKDYSSKYEAEFGNHQLQTIFIPILTEQFINLKELQDLTQQAFLNQYWGIIITSPRASKGWETVLEKLSNNDDSKLLDHLKKLPIFVPGEGTSSNLELIGCNNIVGKESGNADILFHYIENHYNQTIQQNSTSKKLLFLVGDKTRPTLPNKMTEIGIKYEKFQIYNTFKCHQFDDSMYNIKESQLDWIAFFSPSGVHYSWDKIKSWLDGGNIKVAAIGDTTKVHLESLGIHVSACPAKPNPTELVQCILANIAIN